MYLQMFTTSVSIYNYCSFSPKILGVSLTFCQKVVDTAGGIFLPVGENLRRSDFEKSPFENFSKLKAAFCEY